MKKYSLVIVSAPNHFEMVNRNKEYYFEFLPITQIVVVGEAAGKEYFKEDRRIEFVDEAGLYPGLDKMSVRRLVEDQGGHMTRSNWYFQQFLKMAYAFRCQEEYYIVWDADTVPVRPVELFENGQPQFSYCDEYREDYFITLNKLFHGQVKRQEDKSFIVEHMVIKTDFMRELVESIERDDSLNGKYFYGKIISVIDSAAIKVAGFSEFETYANYVLTRHRGVYGIRQLKAFRYGLVITGYELDREKVNWLGKSRDTVSLEHFCRPSIWRRRWLNVKTYEGKSVDEIWEEYNGSVYQRIDMLIKYLLDIKGRVIYLGSRIPDKLKEHFQK